MLKPFGELDIKLKRKSEKPKILLLFKRREKKRRPAKAGEKISTRIAADFLRFNFVCFGLLIIFYVMLYLAYPQFRWVQSLVESGLAFLSHFVSGRVIIFLRSNSLVAALLVQAVIFLLSALWYSVSTLKSFDRLWLSLPAVVSDEEEIQKFPQGFSDVEIALHGIKHDVYAARQAAALAEAKKNDLVMYLAHDLKTPLTSIIGYLSLLSECPDLPAEQRAKCVGIALDKAYRLETLINEFFEITRFNLQNITPEKNKIDLLMMLEQITDEFYPMFSEKGISAYIDMPEKIVMYADADKMARLFDNLLKNAVNYCYENTDILIGARVKNGKVIIKFRNCCDEIPQEKLDRLFDKFFRLDSSRSTSAGGSGLGLAISKQIAELHGGKITAKSTREHTDFTVVIPFDNAEN